MSRQNYYALRCKRLRETIEEEFIVELVKAERLLQPRIGGRKLLVLLKPEFEKADIKIGRDRFFAVLKKHGLLVEPIKRKPITTYSRHYLPVSLNLLKHMHLTTPNQAWVADITYIQTDEGFIYLALITDAYSRKIVGYHAGSTLEVEGALQALEMAKKSLSKGQQTIHHSDRGSQYCSHMYYDACQKSNIQMSMTEELHVYENAKAERVNGILKQEYGLGLIFRTQAQAKKTIEQAVFLYNNRRPHQELGYRIPANVHNEVA